MYKFIFTIEKCFIKLFYKYEIIFIYNFYPQANEIVSLGKNNIVASSHLFNDIMQNKGDS